MPGCSVCERHNLGYTEGEWLGVVGTGRVNFHLAGMFVFGSDERIYFDSEKENRRRPLEGAPADCFC